MDGNRLKPERPARIYLLLMLAWFAIGGSGLQPAVSADEGAPSPVSSGELSPGQQPPGELSRSELSRSELSPSELSPGMPAEILSKPLPPLDCWRCPGPPARGPCRPHHPGFLYYGTWPWDDDPVNGFNDCPRGDCGRVGVHLTLGWIHLHQGHARPLRRHGGKPGDIGRYQHGH